MGNLRKLESIWASGTHFAYAEVTMPSAEKAIDVKAMATTAKAGFKIDTRENAAKGKSTTPARIRPKKKPVALFQEQL